MDINSLLEGLLDPISAVQSPVYAGNGSQRSPSSPVRSGQSAATNQDWDDLEWSTKSRQFEDHCEEAHHSPLLQSNHEPEQQSSMPNKVDEVDSNMGELAAFNSAARQDPNKILFRHEKVADSNGVDPFELALRSIKPLSAILDEPNQGLMNLTQGLKNHSISLPLQITPKNHAKHQSMYDLNDVQSHNNDYDRRGDFGISSSPDVDQTGKASNSNSKGVERSGFQDSAESSSHLQHQRQGDLRSLLGSSEFNALRHITNEEAPEIANEITCILDRHQGCLTAASLGSKIAKHDPGMLFRIKSMCGGLVPLLEIFPHLFHLEVCHPNIHVRTPSAASRAKDSSMSRKRAAKMAAAKKSKKESLEISKVENERVTDSKGSKQEDREEGMTRQSIDQDFPLMLVGRKSFEKKVLEFCKKVLICNTPKSNVATWKGLSTSVLCNRMARAVAMEQGVSKAVAAKSVFKRIRSNFGGLVQLLKRHPSEFFISKSAPLEGLGQRSAVTRVRLCGNKDPGIEALTTNEDSATTEYRSACLHIGHIESHMTEVWLRREFREYGIIEKIRIRENCNSAFKHQGFTESCSDNMSTSMYNAGDDNRIHHQVANGKVIKDGISDDPSGLHKSGHSSGRRFAFITFRRVEDAELAFKNLTKQDFWNSNLHFKRRPVLKHNRKNRRTRKQERRSKTSSSPTAANLSIPEAQSNSKIISSDEKDLNAIEDMGGNDIDSELCTNVANTGSAVLVRKPGRRARAKRRKRKRKKKNRLNVKDAENLHFSSLSDCNDIKNENPLLNSESMLSREQSVSDIKILSTTPKDHVVNTGSSSKGKGQNLIPSRHLWVGRCHRTSKDHLERVFSNFGIVENVSYDKRDNFAFIDFLSVDAAERAFHAMQGAVVGARKVQLAFGRLSDNEEFEEELFNNLGEGAEDSAAAAADDDAFEIEKVGFYYGGTFFLS